MKNRVIKVLLTIMMAMVVGLMPVMSQTVYAAPTETLLTTITATGKEQANYSTANVATVSFSYTAEGSSAYLANWGWWGYGWKATVTAVNNGYTITKCVFYDDANRTATDSEAPFVVETTEEDKTPKVNGNPILADTSKGIKKIEVYGYATPAASYSVTITPGNNMTKTTDSGAESQTVTAGQAMDTVTYTASTNYHFDEFTDIESNGVKAARTDSTTVTVSGIPTGDVSITVPGAVADSVAVTGVSISPTSKSVSKNEVFAITATVSPESATNKKVKWSVSGSGITLYSDQDCNTQMTLNSETTDTTVYAKAGTGYVMATVTVTSAEKANLSADCNVESGMTPITTKITLIYDANGGTPGSKWPEGNTIEVEPGAGIDFGSYWALIDDGSLVSAPTGLVCEGITITDADGSTTYAYGDNTGTYKFQKDSIIKFNWIEDKFYPYSGDGGTWKKGSTSTLDFTFKRSVLDGSTYDCFTGIQVDGNDVERNDKNYTDSYGSVNINLKPAYLETLSEGEHTLTAIFTDNKTASAKFTITKESSGGGSSSSDTVYKIPRTGID